MVTLLNGISEKLELRKIAWSQIAAYTASKFTAAGIVFLAFVVVTSGFDLYDMPQVIREFSGMGLSLWWIFYGYAVLFSIGVDAALIKMRDCAEKRWLIFLLYICGGYIPFIIVFPGFPNPWSLIAGFFGAICSVFFLAATYAFRRNAALGALAAILLIGGCLYLSTADYTKTKQWSEILRYRTYQASFAYFQGEKEIPIEVGAGQT